MPAINHASEWQVRDLHQEKLIGALGTLIGAWAYEPAHARGTWSVRVSPTKKRPNPLTKTVFVGDIRFTSPPRFPARRFHLY